MVPTAGVDVAGIPPETQVLLIERGDGRLVLIAPLAIGPMRFALRGGTNGLTLIGTTGDPWTLTSAAPACLVAIGDCPYTMWREAAAALAAVYPEVGLARAVRRPAMADWLGWCTWDAFYQEVDETRVMSGLESFRRVGCLPRWMILDDGWLSLTTTATGERRLADFAPDAVKFPTGLAPLIARAKQEFGLHEFWVWHAFGGYWGGADARLGFDVRDQLRRLDAAIASNPPDNADWMEQCWGDIVGTIEPKDAAAFFAGLHASLAAAGVDGVKVDNQASVEGLAHGLGGRVAMMRAYHAALEASTALNFRGNLINCMSCSNDMLYASRASNCTRTSTDFWPKRPDSHGLHLYTNAAVGGWFGEFVHPDWDSFQTTHPAAWFHAAGRAVSGGPIYIGDKPDSHDVAVLRAIALRDGSVSRCLDPGRLARDCLFHDPVREALLLKIINRNHCGTVVAAFNSHHDQGSNIAGAISPQDHPNNGVGDYVMWFHRQACAKQVSYAQRVPLSLTALEWEIATIVPLIAGTAVIGLEGLLNCGGALRSVERSNAGVHLVLADGGCLLMWHAGPVIAMLGSALLKVTSHGALKRIIVPAMGACQVDITWKESP